MKNLENILMRTINLKKMFVFKHLSESQESYRNHCTWAVTSGCKMILAGMASVIHGIVPALFTFTSAKCIVDLYYQRLHNHVNKDYQKYIRLMSDRHANKN